MPNPLIPTKYDTKVDRLQGRLKRQERKKRNLRQRVKRPGAQPKAQRKLGRLNKRLPRTGNRLRNVRAKSFIEREQNRPQAPIPHSSAYESTVGRLRRDLQSSQADITGRRAATEQQYGFTDQSNPFSVARQLQQRAKRARRSSTNTYAAAGQLYSGALSNRRASDRSASEQALDRSLREYQAELAGFAREGTRAQTAFDEGVAGAEAQRLEDALQDRPEPSEAPARPGYVKDFLKQKRQRERGQKKNRGGDNRERQLRKRLRTANNPKRRKQLRKRLRKLR